MGTAFLTVTPAVPLVSTTGLAPAIPHLLVLLTLISSYTPVQFLLHRQVPEHFTDFTVQAKDGSSG